MAVSLALLGFPIFGYAEEYSSLDEWQNQGEVSDYSGKRLNLELTAEDLARIYNEDKYKNEFVPGEVIVGMKFTVAESRGWEPRFPGLSFIEAEKHHSDGY